MIFLLLYPQLVYWLLTRTSLELDRPMFVSYMCPYFCLWELLYVCRWYRFSHCPLYYTLKHHVLSGKRVRKFMACTEVKKIKRKKNRLIYYCVTPTPYMQTHTHNRIKSSSDSSIYSAAFCTRDPLHPTTHTRKTLHLRMQQKTIKPFFKKIPSSQKADPKKYVASMFVSSRTQKLRE